MPLINVMREISLAAGWSERDFDVAISVYIEAGTLTEINRQDLVRMSVAARQRWLANASYPVDAMPMIGLDFDAHGYILPTGLAKFSEDVGG